VLSILSANYENEYKILLEFNKTNLEHWESFVLCGWIILGCFFW